MIEMRMETTGAFTVSGKKTWISGQDNSLFAKFWDTCEKDGTVKLLKSLADPAITQAAIIGVSRVEDDPTNRAFDFYIASECAQAPGCESFTVPACTWAIFRNTGKPPMALVDAEMEAFMKWLPNSCYEHANAPEMEVYKQDGSVEFWLPVREKK